MRYPWFPGCGLSCDDVAICRSLRRTGGLGRLTRDATGRCAHTLRAILGFLAWPAPLHRAVSTGHAWAPEVLTGWPPRHAPFLSPSEGCQTERQLPENA